jgi:hypothetical protein
MGRGAAESYGVRGRGYLLLARSIRSCTVVLPTPSALAASARLMPSPSTSRRASHWPSVMPTGRTRRAQARRRWMRSRRRTTTSRSSFVFRRQSARQPASGPLYPLRAGRKIARLAGCVPTTPASLALTPFSRWSRGDGIIDGRVVGRLPGLGLRELLGGKDEGGTACVRRRRPRLDVGAKVPMEDLTLLRPAPCAESAARADAPRRNDAITLITADFLRGQLVSLDATAFTTHAGPPTLDLHIGLAIACPPPDGPHLVIRDGGPLPPGRWPRVGGALSRRTLVMLHLRRYSAPRVMVKRKSTVRNGITEIRQACPRGAGSMVVLCAWATATA